MEESKLQTQMGSWEDGGGDAWVRLRCKGGDYKVRHELILCLRAQTWEMEKVVLFIYLFIFCYHPNPAMANYRDVRGTNKQINT